MKNPVNESWLTRINKFPRLIAKLGFLGTIAYALYGKLFPLVFKFGLGLKNQSFGIPIKGFEHPVWLRPGSSDPAVFSQVLIQEEYACFNNSNPKLIIDCGANVGYTSVYFLNQFPHAHVIAVEPDSNNAAICQKNLLPYGERATLIQAGIWSHEAALVVCRGGYHDGSDWALQVRECEPHEEPDVQGIDIETILEGSSFSQIDILKIDIERSESIVFASRCNPWLDKVKNIAIELHDHECEQIFFNAMKAYEYETLTSGELTICKEIKPRKVLDTTSIS